MVPFITRTTPGRRATTRNGRTTNSTTVRSITVAAATAALATMATLTGQPATAAPAPEPLLVCENGVCLLNPQGVDTDADGYSDADEASAGTDPKDPSSHPGVLQILNGWFAGLRPEGPGIREVIVLPEFAPNGAAIGNASIFAFGPQRGDAMKRLGLTNARLGGVDASNGLRVTLDLSNPSRRTGHPGMSIGRIDPLVAGGWNTFTEDDMGFGVFSILENGKDIGYRTEGKDGSMTVNVSGSTLQQTAERSAVEQTPDGGTRQVGHSTSTSTHPDGSKTTVTVDSVTTTDGNGTTVVDKTSVTTTVDAQGKSGDVKVTSREIVTTQADGTKVTEKAVHVTDKQGMTTTSFSTTTTTPDGTTSCTGSSGACPKAGYVNTEYEGGPMPGDMIVITPDLARQLVIDAGGDHTNQGDSGVEPDPEQFDTPIYSSDNPGVIYVDTSNDAVWWRPTPTTPDPDRVGGNVTPVRNVTDPIHSCLATSPLPCPS